MRLTALHGPVGVMIDFLCLPQKPFATEEDGARFLVSLKAINTWYFHPKTYTLLVTASSASGCARAWRRVSFSSPRTRTWN